jgi:hypothetical protein
MIGKLKGYSAIAARGMLCDEYYLACYSLEVPAVALTDRELDYLISLAEAFDAPKKVTLPLEIYRRRARGESAKDVSVALKMGTQNIYSHFRRFRHVWSFLNQVKLQVELAEMGRPSKVTEGALSDELNRHNAKIALERESTELDRLKARLKEDEARLAEHKRMIPITQQRIKALKRKIKRYPNVS